MMRATFSSNATLGPSHPTAALIWDPFARLNRKEQWFNIEGLLTTVFTEASLGAECAVTTCHTDHRDLACALCTVARTRRTCSVQPQGLASQKRMLRSATSC